MAEGRDYEFELVHLTDADDASFEDWGIRLLCEGGSLLFEPSELFAATAELEAELVRRKLGSAAKALRSCPHCDGRGTVDG